MCNIFQDCVKLFNTEKFKGDVSQITSRQCQTTKITIEYFKTKMTNAFKIFCFLQATSSFVIPTSLDMYCIKKPLAPFLKLSDHY